MEPDQRWASSWQEKNVMLIKASNKVLACFIIKVGLPGGTTNRTAAGVLQNVTDQGVFWEAKTPLADQLSTKTGKKKQGCTRAHSYYTDNEVVLLRSTSCWDTKPLRVEYILA